MLRAHASGVPVDLRAQLTRLASVRVADDQKWILALLRKQGPPIVALLWRMLGCEADVLDAYQSAICSLAARGKTAMPWNRSAYFYRTAMNAGIQILRVRRRGRALREGLAAEVGEESERPNVRLEAAEEIERIRSAVWALPQQLRGVVILREMAGLPYARVARILGIQVSTARLYRRQAILRLADMIAEEDR